MFTHKCKVKQERQEKTVVDSQDLFLKESIDNNQGSD